MDHGRNFMKLNKLAIQEGKAKSKDVSDFRNSHDCRIITKPGQLLKLKNQVPVDLDRNATFGAPTKGQQASMSALLHHKYEHEWVKAQITKEEKSVAVQKRREQRLTRGPNASPDTSDTEESGAERSRRMPKLSASKYAVGRSTPSPALNRMHALDHPPRAYTAPGFRPEDDEYDSEVDN